MYVSLMTSPEVNSQVRRPTHLSLTPFDNIHNVNPKARYFTTADALCGYWQINPTEEDQHLTSFIVPYGRFQHYRGPMGFAATASFCLNDDMVLQGPYHPTIMLKLSTVFFYMTRMLTNILSISKKCSQFTK